MKVPITLPGGDKEYFRCVVYNDTNYVRVRDLNKIRRAWGQQSSHEPLILHTPFGNLKLTPLFSRNHRHGKSG